MFFTVCGFWVAVVFIAFFIFRKKNALQKKKGGKGVHNVEVELGEVFGKSHEINFFLPIIEENNRQKNEKHVENSNTDTDEDEDLGEEVDIDDFEVEYDDDVGMDFQSYPSSAFAETVAADVQEEMMQEGMLFDNLRQAIKIVENLDANALSKDVAGEEPVKHARRVFKMLDETELLQKMRSITPEMNARMDVIMNE